MYQNMSYVPCCFKVCFAFSLRKKSYSARLFACKRTHNGSQSLPTFCEYAPSALVALPAILTAFYAGLRGGKNLNDCETVDAATVFRGLEPGILKIEENVAENEGYYKRDLNL